MNWQIWTHCNALKVTFTDRKEKSLVSKFNLTFTTKEPSFGKLQNRRYTSVNEAVGSAEAELQNMRRQKNTTEKCADWTLPQTKTSCQEPIKTRMWCDHNCLRLVVFSPPSPSSSLQCIVSDWWKPLELLRWSTRASLSLEREPSSSSLVRDQDHHHIFLTSGSA